VTTELVRINFGPDFCGFHGCRLCYRNVVIQEIPTPAAESFNAPRLVIVSERPQVATPYQDDYDDDYGWGESWEDAPEVDCPTQPLEIAVSECVFRETTSDQSENTIVPEMSFDMLMSKPATIAESATQYAGELAVEHIVMIIGADGAARPLD